MTRFELLTIATILSITACKASEAETADASAPAPTAAAASLPTDATPKAVDAAPSAGERVAIPAAPTLPSLKRPGGPQAEGNVPSDVDAAMAATKCPIAEGRLTDCPAKDAYQTASNDFVKAKAQAHVDTLFNLLGAGSPAVRLLVLDAGPVHYIEVYDEERKDDPSLYEPLLAAALAETDPHVREAFAYQVARVPIGEQKARFVPVLGELAATYSAEEAADRIVDRISELWDDDCAACEEALVAAALRNPDPAVRVRAMQGLERDGVDAKTLCDAAARNLDVTDEELLRPAVEIFTGETPGCSDRYDAWLAEFPAKARAGTLSSVWLDGAATLLETHAEAHAPKVRAMAVSLQGVVPADHDQRPTIDDLATPS